MVELIGQEDGTFRHTKVLGNVLVSGFEDDFRMSDRVAFVFVNIRIQRCES